MSRKQPLVQMLLATAIIGIGLWVWVKWFLSDTGDDLASIDVRTLGHLRDSAERASRPASAVDETITPTASTEPAVVNPAAQRSSTGATRSDNKPGSQQASIDNPEEQQDLINRSDEDLASEAREQVLEIHSAENGVTTGGDSLTNTSVGVGSTKYSGSVSARELEERANARRQRLLDLGVIQEKPPEPTIAVDVSLQMPSRCEGAAIAKVPVGLKYRHESSNIKGESLNALESLVALYRQCEEGEFVLQENPLGRTDATETLTQMRFNEVKYFFIQHSISIDAVQFPEE